MDFQLTKANGSDVIAYATASAGPTLRGGHTWGAPVTGVSAWVEPHYRRTVDAQGRPVETSHLIITETQLKLGMAVWIDSADSADQTKAKRVVQVDPIHDERGGIVHYEVLVGGRGGGQ